MATPSADDFDFILFVVCDIHGLYRGRMFAARRMQEAITNGVGIYGGICHMSIYRDDSPYHADFDKGGTSCNSSMMPLLHTMKACPHLGQGKFKVGRVLCSMVTSDGRPDMSVPRTAAEKVIETLQNELSFTVKSAFEIEFQVTENEGNKYFGHNIMLASTTVIEECQGLLFDFIDHMGKIGVSVDSVQTEMTPGGFEVTLDVAEGLEACDKTLDVKNSLKSFMKSRGYTATFMTTLGKNMKHCNALHFNHSLWTPSGANAFLDTNATNKLSVLGRHWLAGLIEHAPAMTAFCCPTINCYRSSKLPFMPTYNDWSIGGRDSAFRVKIEGKENIYIENRLARSSSNPYLVLMCTLAAGIDGVKRKLPLSKECEPSCLLPTDLESALMALEADAVIKEAMGENLVKYFIFNKRECELQDYLAIREDNEEDRINAEYEYYYQNA